MVLNNFLLDFAFKIAFPMGDQLKYPEKFLCQMHIYTSTKSIIFEMAKKYIYTSTPKKIACGANFDVFLRILCVFFERVDCALHYQSIVSGYEMMKRFYITRCAVISPM